MGMNERPALVIIGGGMAGQRLLEALVAKGFQARTGLRIVLIGAEPAVGYNRILLSPLLAGEVERDALWGRPVEWYRAEGIELHRGDPVVAIDRSRRRLTTASGAGVDYHRLVIATGSRTRRVRVFGDAREGVSEFRTLGDVDALLEDDLVDLPVCVVGAGLLGLEAAEGLRQRGARVTVVHRGAWPMNRQLDAEGGRQLAARLGSRGLAFELERTLAEMRADRGGRLQALKLDDGRWLEAQRLIHAAGIEANFELGRDAGLECGQGICVDDRLVSSDPLIHALGECCEHRGATFGLVEPIWAQVEVLAAVLCGEPGCFEPLPSATRLKISGIALYAFGDPYPRAGDRWLRYFDPGSGDYRALCLNGGVIRAGNLINDTRLGPAWYHHFLASTPVEPGDDWLFDAAPIARPSQHQDPIEEIA